jgi:hypothetical protein
MIDETVGGEFLMVSWLEDIFFFEVCFLQK